MLGQGDIQLGKPKLDARLEIRGPIPSLVRTVLRDEEVQSVLAAMAGSTGSQVFKASRSRFRIEQDHVCAESAGIEDVANLVEDAVRVASALGASMERWFAPLSGPLELVHEPDPDGSLLRLRGDFAGFKLLVRHQPGTEQVRVQATLTGRDWPGLEVGRKEERDDRSELLSLGDLILDRVIAIRGDDAEVGRALLARDTVRGPLLAVVMDHGGQLDGDQISLVTDHLEPVTLVAATTEVVALARALVEAHRQA